MMLLIIRANLLSFMALCLCMYRVYFCVVLNNVYFLHSFPCHPVMIPLRLKGYFCNSSLVPDNESKISENEIGLSISQLTVDRAFLHQTFKDAPCNLVVLSFFVDFSRNALKQILSGFGIELSSAELKFVPLFRILDKVKLFLQQQQLWGLYIIYMYIKSYTCIINNPFHLNFSKHQLFSFHISNDLGKPIHGLSNINTYREVC